MFNTNRKRTKNLDRLLTAVLETGLPLESALQDEACRKDAQLERLLREDVETARRLQTHSVRMDVSPEAIRNGRRRLEAQIRSQRADWRGVFWLKRLDWGVSIALTIILLFAGTAQLIGQFRHAISIAMPGDRLYFIKMAEEQARLDLAGSPEERLRLHLDFVRHRAIEFESLVLEEQFALLPQVMAGMESALGRAHLIENQMGGEIPAELQNSLAEMEQMVRRQVAFVRFYTEPLPASLQADMERVAWLAFDGRYADSTP